MDVLKLEQQLQQYYDHFLDSVYANPVHVVIEVVLITFIAYILLAKRAYDPAKRGYGARGAPQLTDKEKEQLIAEWQPEPLVPVSSSIAAVSAEPAYIVSAFVSPTRVRVQNSSDVKIAFTSQDFLGLSSNEVVKKAAKAALEHYTVGSCGPRGFYGTTKAHLDLEQDLATFMRTAESITYSDALATIASAIPAFAKRGDVLLIDNAANVGIVQGASLSRSKIVWFEHNDMTDLERHLKDVADSDRRKKDVSLEQRRFIVVEGLYAATGDLCKLSEVVALARKYRWRVILDDSLGVGVLGATGRGTVEHAGLEIGDVDVLVGSLSTTLGSVGGFCVGTREVVDHQRLSGQGYCFSASAPPYLCVTATQALRMMLDQPGMLQTLQARSKYAHAALTKAVGNKMRLLSDPVSPIKHLALTAALPAAAATATAANGGAGAGAAPTSSKAKKGGAATSSSAPAEVTIITPARRAALEGALDVVVAELCKRGVLVSRAHQLREGAESHAPTLKIAVTAEHTEADIDLLAKKLAEYLQG